MHGVLGREDSYKTCLFRVQKCEIFSSYTIKLVTLVAFLQLMNMQREKKDRKGADLASAIFAVNKKISTILFSVTMSRKTWQTTVLVWDEKKELRKCCGCLFQKPVLKKWVYTVTYRSRSASVKIVDVIFNVKIFLFKIYSDFSSSVDLVSYKNCLDCSFPASLDVPTRLWGRECNFQMKVASWFFHHAYIQKITHFPSEEEKNMQRSMKIGIRIIFLD